MELRIHSKLICTAIAALAFAAPGFAKKADAPMIKQFPLDEQTVLEIPISQDAPTTVMFPSAPTALEGAHITTQPDQPAPVMLSHTPGRFYFSVRALQPDARATLNVIHKNKTYIFRFSVSEQPYGSVTLFEERIGGGLAHASRGVEPEMLLSLLDRAKSYRLVKDQRPDAVRQVEHRAPTANHVTRYENFTVTLEEVFRFEDEDTLVFKIKLQNTGTAEITYVPHNLGVKVGRQIYPASIADASGIIPPKAETIAYFAVTGTPSGDRANLSVKNDFTILVPVTKRKTTTSRK